jgi:hypothetical protein
MVLKDDLYYYEDQNTYTNNKPPKGVVKLDSFFITRKDGPNEDHEFTIFAVPKPLVCQAESAQDLDMWVKKITYLGQKKGDE